MKGFKGFNNLLQCTPSGKVFQYELGKEFKEAAANLCSNGFHFCENPLDVFGYYPPSVSRYATVEADEVSEETSDDSKRSCKTIRIETEIKLPSIISAGVKFIMEKVEWNTAKESNTGDQSAATNTGYRSAATNTGDQSAATVEGKKSVACSLGYEGKAKAIIGSAICVVERDDEYEIIAIKAAIIDGVILKENTFYSLSNGEFIEVE
jgi:hypothetical protein